MYDIRGRCISLLPTCHHTAIAIVIDLLVCSDNLARRQRKTMRNAVLGRRSAIFCRFSAFNNPQEEGKIHRLLIIAVLVPIMSKNKMKKRCSIRRTSSETVRGAVRDVYLSRTANTRENFLHSAGIQMVVTQNCSRLYTCIGHITRYYTQLFVADRTYC